MKKGTATLIAMCVALSMAALDDTVVNVALPKMQANLDLSVNGLQWILNAYLMPIACLVLPAGTLGDRYGRRSVFLSGLWVFIGASILVGLAFSSPMVIIGRLLQGIGAAALLPTSLAILSEAFPNPRERTKAIGIWSGVSGLALIVGPALGGILVDGFGWRSIFFLNVPLGVLTFWLTCRALPIPPSQPARSAKARNKPIDIPGMLFSVVMIAAFIMLLTGGNHTQIFSWQTLLLSGLTLGSAIAFITIEKHSAHPMLPLTLFRQPTFTTAIVTNALLFFMLVSLMFLFSLFLQQVQGYSAIATGLRFLPLNGAFILASILSGYCAARIGWRTATTAGFAVAALGVLSLSQIQPDTAYTAMLWKLIVVGFGVGFTLSPLTAAGMGSASPSAAGVTAALLNTSTRLGGALGIAIQGNVFTHSLGTQLNRTLTGLDLPLTAQQSIVAEALGYGATRPEKLTEYLSTNVSLEQVSLEQVSLEQLELAIHQSFVAGMQNVMSVAAIALLLGMVLCARYIRANSFSKPIRQELPRPPSRRSA